MEIKKWRLKNGDIVPNPEYKRNVISDFYLKIPNKFHFIPFLRTYGWKETCERYGISIETVEDWYLSKVELCAVENTCIANICEIFHEN